MVHLNDIGYMENLIILNYFNIDFEIPPPPQKKCN